MPRHPRSVELKIVAIGNSRGVRLPKAVIDKYAMRETALLEEREDGLLLRSKQDKRLSWEETYREMAREAQGWGDLDGTLADGLDPAD